VNLHGHKERETPNILKTTQANNSRVIFSKAITLEHSEVFNECPLAYLIYTAFKKKVILT
jgi:hypothetical protein